MHCQGGYARLQAVTQLRQAVCRIADTQVGCGTEAVHTSDPDLERMRTQTPQRTNLGLQGLHAEIIGLLQP